jgi:hypothetical protein
LREIIVLCHPSSSFLTESFLVFDSIVTGDDVEGRMMGERIGPLGFPLFYYSKTREDGIFVLYSVKSTYSYGMEDGVDVYRLWFGTKSEAPLSLYI